jgi:hypothetical protein
MQSLQLHLTGATRSWLSKLEKGTIEAGRNSQSNSQATLSRHTSGQCR